MQPGPPPLTARTRRDRSMNESRDTRNDPESTVQFQRSAPRHLRPSGLLGAGKTPLLSRGLDNRDGRRVAVITRNISEVYIDPALMGRDGTYLLDTHRASPDYRASGALRNSSAKLSATREST